MPKTKKPIKPKSLKMEFTLEEFEQFANVINSIHQNITFSNELKDPWESYEGKLSLLLTNNSIEYTIETITKNQLAENVPFDFPLSRLCT